MCYEESLGTLKTKIEELEEMKKDVVIKVDGIMEKADTENLPQHHHQVKGWIERAGRTKSDVDELIGQADQEIQNACFGSCCPKNCWSRYKIGKKIEETLRGVDYLCQQGKERLDSMDTYLGTFDKVFRCLEEKEKGVIGLYGPGGVGKTALMTQISNNLINSPIHFDFKIWVVGSQDPNPERIQGDIGKEIGFLEDRWKEKSFEQKARELSEALLQKKFLMLLDDIWKPVNLDQIGVPPPNSENGSKLVFTTRSEEVCNQMGADEKIKVGCLMWEKAWKLFKENVGEDTLNIHSNIPALAEKIARMCNGLPLALITIGRAMARKKTIQEWHQSIEVLSKSTSEFSGTSNQDLALLKFGYDSLPSDKVKSCFLYCALFPEDFSINKCNLIDYWIGEGFLGAYNDVGGARNEGYNIIGTLLHACLLEDNGKDVKMHDLIRDMALWITREYSNEKDKYFVAAGIQLDEELEIGDRETVRRMSLMANHIQNLAKAPRCHDLLTLFLGKNNLKMISGAFFQSMPSLKVLDLSENIGLTELPSGISRLVSLQYLNLSRTSIRQLPLELRNLVKLKCLNLEHTYELYTIQLQIISSFSNLNVLRMVHCASSDRVVGDGVQTGGHGTMARDWQRLEHLNVLTITIRSEYSLQSFASFNMFQNCTQALSLHQFRHSRFLDISFLEGMNCLDDLEFIDCVNLKELKIEDSLIMRGARFNSLHKVSIVNCSKLEDLTWVALAPNLEILWISRCSNMVEIIRQEKLGEGILNAFQKLEVLRLVSLPQLKSIYPNALPFPYLKEIVVDDCQNLKRLPLNSNSAKEHRIVIQGWDDWWESLEWENEASKRTFLPSFKSCMY